MVCHYSAMSATWPNKHPLFMFPPTQSGIHQGQNCLCEKCGIQYSMPKNLEGFLPNHVSGKRHTNLSPGGEPCQWLMTWLHQKACPWTAGDASHLVPNWSMGTTPQHSVCLSHTLCPAPCACSQLQWWEQALADGLVGSTWICRSGGSHKLQLVPPL